MPVDGGLEASARNAEATALLAASVAADGDLLFVPAHLRDIPPPSLAELHAIFKDIDYSAAGVLSPDDVRVALDVSGVALPPRRLALLLRAMQALAAGPGGVDGAGGGGGGGGGRAGSGSGGAAPPASSSSVACITPDAFARCLYAAILCDRDVLPAAAYATFPDSSFTAESATGCLRARRRVWLLLDDPFSSAPARGVALLLVATILTSVLAYCVETVPGVHGRYDRAFDTIEAVTVGVFTVEFLGRAGCTPTPHAFFRSPLNVIDLFSIAPYYVEMALVSAGAVSVSAFSGSSLLRAMRLVRVFRLFKIGRYLQWMRVFGQTLAASVVPLLMLAFIFSVLLLLFSTGGYYLERGEWSAERGCWVDVDDECSPFQSIPASLWWGVVSLTAVGYGDVTPLTVGGKLLCCVCFFLGIMISAIPVSIISGNFHDEYTHMQRLTKLKKVHAAGPPPPPLDTAPPAEGEGAREGGGAEGGGPAAAEGEAAGYVAHAATERLPSGEDEEREDAAAARAATPAEGSRGGGGGRAGAASPSPPASALSPLAEEEDRGDGDGDGGGEPAGQRAVFARDAAAGGGDDAGGAGLISSDRRAARRGVDDRRLQPPGSACDAGGSGSGGAGGSGGSGGSAGGGGHGGAAGGTPPPATPPPNTAVRAMMRHALVSTPSAFDVMAAARATAAAEALEARARAASGAGDGDGAGGDGAHAAGSGGALVAGEHAHPDHHSADDLALAAALRAVAALSLAGGSLGDGGDGSSVDALRSRIDASWSEPFLRTTLQVVRDSRRSLMAGLKSAELQSREYLNLELEGFVDNVGTPDSGTMTNVVRRAQKEDVV